jgi:flagellar biosynthesis regulator FlbT
MPLHLKLRRGERLLVNGAVLEVGPRYGEILVHNHTNCLREGDLLQEEGRRRRPGASISRSR